MTYISGFSLPFKKGTEIVSETRQNQKHDYLGDHEQISCRLVVGISYSQTFFCLFSFFFFLIWYFDLGLFVINIAIAVALLWAVGESHRTCGSAEKTSKLMEKDENYRRSRELEHKRAMIFSQRMKMKQDHSFRKFKNLDKIHTKHKENNGNKGSKRSLKYSEYDDKIDSEPVIYIPIVFHVLYDDSDHNLGDTQLQSQVYVLNKDFRALNDEIVDNEVPSIWLDRVGDAKIQFYIYGINRVAIFDASTTCLDETLMKQTYRGGSDAVDPKHYLNIWICDITTTTGSTLGMFSVLLSTITNKQQTTNNKNFKKYEKFKNLPTSLIDLFCLYIVFFCFFLQGMHISHAC